MLPALLLVVASTSLAAPTSRDVANSNSRRAPVDLTLRSGASGSSLRRRSTDTGLRSNSWETYYFASLDIGTPPQSFQVQIDTGSSTLWVYNASCPTQDCLGGPYFDPSKSSTYHQTEYEYIQTYVDKSSFNGSWAEEEISLGGWGSKYIFGAVNTTNPEVSGGYPGSSISGLVGLGWAGSGHGDPKAFSQLVLSNRKDENVDPQFGLYLGRRQGNWGAKDENDSGVLTMGGVNSSYFDGDLHYAPTIPCTTRDTSIPGNKVGDVTAPDGWYIKPDGARIGEHALAVGDNNYAIIDSGTTGMCIPTATYHDLFKNIKGAKLVDGEYEFDCDVPDFNVTMSFAGLDIPLYWGDMMYSNDKDGKVCMSNVHPSSALGEPEDEWLLGDAFMRNVYSAFRYDPPGVGFALLKDEFNQRPGVVPSAFAKGAATGGSASDTGSAATPSTGSQP